MTLDELITRPRRLRRPTWEDVRRLLREKAAVAPNTPLALWLERRAGTELRDGWVRLGRPVPGSPLV